MRSLDPQVSRVLEATSRLMRRSLGLSGDEAESEFVVASKLLPGSSRVVLRDLDERPFAEDERSFLKEIADLIFNDLHARDEAQALDQRMRLLEKESIELSMKNRALTELSSRDALTGLFNRWYVIEKIEAELNRCLRHGSPLSILMLDVDNLRAVNETHGHGTGDLVLQAVGRLIRESCRVYDIPGRYGGEEFCLMLPETTLEKTAPVAERIRARVESAQVSAVDRTIRFTASIGVAGLESVPEEAIFGAPSLLERADRAVHTAKDRGRNRIELWNATMTTKTRAES